MLPRHPLSLEILEGNFAEGDHITATEKSNRLAFSKNRPPAVARQRLSIPWRDDLRVVPFSPRASAALFLSQPQAFYLSSKRGFQTFSKPKFWKSFVFGVAKCVTPE